MSNKNYEIPAEKDIRKLHFKPWDLICGTCNRSNRIEEFYCYFLIKHKQNLDNWNINSGTPRPKPICARCYKRNPDPLLKFMCFDCGNSKPLKNFPKNKLEQDDKVLCKACTERKNRKRLAFLVDKDSNPQNSGISNTPIKKRQLSPIHSNALYNSHQPNFKTFPVKSEITGFDMSSKDSSKVECSGSAYSNTKSLSSIAVPNQKPKLIRDGINPNSTQFGFNNSLSRDKNKDILQTQGQQQEHLQSHIGNTFNITKFDTNIYSLPQLAGRKNPPVNNHNYNSSNMPEGYETSNSRDMNTEKGVSFNSLTLNCAHTSHNQHKAQSPSYSYENIDYYVRQIFDSVQNSLNNEQNSTFIETTSIISSNKTVSTGTNDTSQLNRNNVDISTRTKERPASITLNNPRTRPEFTQFNDRNKAQGDIVSSTTNNNQIEQNVQHNQASIQAPCNILDGIQTSVSHNNLPLATSLPSNLRPIIAIGRYRNKSFDLTNLFGKVYNPLPIPLSSNTSGFSKGEYKDNPRKPIFIRK